MTNTFKDVFKTNKHWAHYIKNTFNYKYNWAVGAYRSSKSISNLVAFALNLETTPDKLHLIIASTVSSARNIFEDADGLLGLRQYFGPRYKQTKYKNSDAGIIQTPTGEKIVVYLGGSMESSYKQFRGWSVGMIVLEEANLLHPNTIQEAKGRTLLAQNPKYFISMNPTSPKASIYNWLHELQDKDMVNYDRSTIYDNPALSEERRNEIIAEFDPDSLFYQQYILGKDIDADGAIYNIRDYNIISEFNPRDYIDYIVVCDQGETISASVFILAAIKQNKETYEFSMDILKNYYWKNEGKNGLSVKMFSDTANDLALFVKECAEIMGRYPSRVLIDQDTEFYRNCKLAFNNNEIGYQLIKYVIKDTIEQRIKSGINLLYSNKLHFFKECEQVIDDFKHAVYDTDKITKTGKFERLKEYTALGHLDSIDAVEYAFTWFKNKLYIK